MKILYVILTCEKYFNRRDAQVNSWQKYIGENDEIIYLSSLEEIEDNYKTTPLKYIKFIQRFERFDNFDWVFFCDDDTFVFPKKLTHLLRYFNCEKSYMIGRTGMYDDFTYCSGGAGFAVSIDLIKKIKKHLLNDIIHYFDNSDTSFGLWAKVSSSELNIVDRVESFQTQHLKHDDNALVDIDSCITFHYCSEYDYKVLNKYLKYAV